MKDLHDYNIIFITHYTELYGANRSLLNLIEGLSLIGIHNITVLTPVKGEINKELEKKKIRNFVIPFKNETHYTNQENNPLKEFLKFFYNWYIVLRYSRKLNVNRKTIIHTNASVTFIGAYFSYWLKVSHVWHIREFGMEDYKIKYNYGYKYFQYWLNKANAVIAISKAIYNKRVENCTAAIKETIYNGVIFSKDLQHQINIQTNKPAINTITFGIIGVISSGKGQEEAIDAFIILQKKFKNLSLIIAGEGDEQYVNSLKIKIANNNLEQQIKFVGFIEETTNFYNAIGCLLMCSKNEALGRVTIEAMSKGVPVIGFDNAGTSEIIKDGVNGFLYRNGVAELTEKITSIIQGKNILPGITKNGFETVKQNFTIEKYAERVTEVYQRIIVT
jgi:glycosyltransferase involved in cell wall biosynthesis